MEEMYLSKIDEKVEELAYHFKNSDDKGKAIFYLNKAGDKAQSLYAFSNAVKYFQDCIDISEITKLEKEQLTQFSKIYNKLAFSQLTVGKRKEAETNSNKSLKYCIKIKDKDTESLVLMSMGNLYGDMGKWDKAIEYSKNSLLITKGLNNLKRKARIINNIGLINLFKGDTSTGYSYLKESMNICKEIKALDVYAMALNNTGIYYDMLGKWGKAVEAYKESLSISEKYNNIIQMSNTMGNIGFAYSSINESEQAIYYFKESIKISERIGDIYNKGINYIHLGEEYLGKDMFKEVKYYISSAEKIFIELEDKLGLADIFKLKAILCKKQKDWKKSEEYFKKAIKIYSQQGDSLNEGESYYEWGDMSILKKDVDSARKKLNKSKKILGSIGVRKHLKEIEEKLHNLKK
jgi:tetratricopeptide (TPR) repeat protein